MTDMQAIERRISRRVYSGTLDKTQQQKLEALVAHANLDTGLSIRFVEGGADAFSGVTKSYGLFKGVHSLFALAGRRGMAHLCELAGHAGQRLVLEATKMGLGTCWVAGTYDKQKLQSELSGELDLVAVITVGPVKPGKSLTERAAGRIAGKKLAPQQMIETVEHQLPDWFLSGVQAAALAPSALNRQPVRFGFANGVANAAVVGEEGLHLVDLGIAKLHFEIGAGGRFELGSGATFVKGE